VGLRVRVTERVIIKWK